jgi:hypothetical protein
MLNRTTRSCCLAAGRVFFVGGLFLPFACGNTEHGGEQTAPAGSGGSAGSVSSGGKAGGRASGGHAQLPPDEPVAGSPTVQLPGTSNQSKTIECGTEQCVSTSTLLPTLFVDPCCVEDACGVSSEVLSAIGASFADKCQAKAQPGEPDAACPSSPPQVLSMAGVSVPVAGFAGCCRAETGTCGVIVDDIASGFGTFARPGLGCADSAPFFGQVPGAACGEAGVGGAAGAGGAPSTGLGGEGGI